MILEKTYREKRLIILFFIVIAFNFQIISLVSSLDSPGLFNPMSDDLEYDNLAKSILAGKGMSYDGAPSVKRTPLYPIFLASVYFIFGHSYLAVYVIQAVLYALIPLLIFLITKEIFNEKAAFLAILIAVFYKPFITFAYYSGCKSLISEHLFMFLMTLAALLFVKGIQRKSNIYLASGSVVLALATLTRPVTTAFPIFILLWILFFMKDKLKVKLQRSFIILLFFAIVIAPWTIRNWLIFKKFIPVSTFGGYSLFTGNNPEAKGGWKPPNYDPIENLNYLSEPEKEKIYFNEGIKFIKNNMHQIPWLLFKKFLVQWMPMDFIITRKYNFFYALICSFGLMGLYYMKKLHHDSGAVWFLIFEMAYFTLLALIFYGDPRFRYVIEPILIIFASCGIYGLFHCSRRKRIAIFISLLVLIFNIALRNLVLQFL